MTTRNLLTLFIVLNISACSDRRLDDFGREDDWTWDSANLKTCTSPDKEKRARADVADGQIELKFGERGEHPVDLTVHHSEMIPEPHKGQWSMAWLDDETFAFQHSELGTKTWNIQGTFPMKVRVLADWRH